MSIEDIAAIINGGGNLALCLCTFFIYRATERLARIEKALQKYMDTDS
jgi:hypothetical protein